MDSMPAYITCYRCGRKGHFKRHCSTPAQHALSADESTSLQARIEAFTRSSRFRKTVNWHAESISRAFYDLDDRGCDGISELGQYLALQLAVLSFLERSRPAPGPIGRQVPCKRQQTPVSEMW
jgi:hypothetical protein